MKNLFSSPPPKKKIPSRIMEGILHFFSLPASIPPPFPIASSLPATIPSLPLSLSYKQYV